MPRLVADDTRGIPIAQCQHVDKSSLPRNKCGWVKARPNTRSYSLTLIEDYDDNGAEDIVNKNYIVLSVNDICCKANKH